MANYDLLEPFKEIEKSDSDDKYLAKTFIAAIYHIKADPRKMEQIETDKKLPDYHQRALMLFTTMVRGKASKQRGTLIHLKSVV